MGKVNKFFICILFFSFTHCSPPSKDINQEKENSKITAKVIGIIDGDTYDILVNNEQVRVRMNGIDAPERGMPFYKVSKNYLSKLCFGKTVNIENVGVDRHGRVLGDTYFEGTYINLEMVKAGMAWHYKEYSNDEQLANAEIGAKKNKNGLWKDARPIEPWRVRSLHRQGISTKDSFNLTNE